MAREAWETAKRNSQGLNPAKYRKFRQKYRNDLAGFIRDCIAWKPGKGPTSYQNEISIKISETNRVSVRGPHGLGKTALMAITTLWFALTRDGVDWKVVTTASAWRQLEKYLWPEIHKWARLLEWSEIGRAPFRKDELFTLKLKLKTGEAFAVASDNPALIEGAHADEILYIFDESKSVPPATFDAAEGALSTPNAKAIAFSTPGEPVGRFYDIQSRKAGYEDWWVRHVTVDEVIAAGRMSVEWAEARARQWGTESSVYKNRVLGEFAANDEDGVIPLSLVEAAIARWYDLQASGRWDDFTCLSADIARFGDDKTAFALRYGWAIREIRKFDKLDTMQSAGRIAGILDAWNGRAIIDVVGLGAGVFDRLREQGYEVISFVAGGRTSFRDQSGELGFVDIRSAAWWNLRELLFSEEIAIPDDDTLIGDLTSPRWTVRSGGKIKVESKDEIKKRIGRSTDDGDAVVMAFWDGLQVTEYAENPLSGYRG